MLSTGDYSEAIRSLGWTFAPDAKYIAKHKDGKLVALAAFENYNGTDIDVHVAATGMTRDWIRAICRFVFEECQCERMTSLNDADNFQMKDYLERLGFEYEGRKRKALPNGSDILIYGMIREDCKWVARASRK